MFLFIMRMTFHEKNVIELVGVLRHLVFDSFYFRIQTIETMSDMSKNRTTDISLTFLKIFYLNQLNLSKKQRSGFLLSEFYSFYCKECHHQKCHLY